MNSFMGSNYYKGSDGFPPAQLESENVRFAEVDFNDTATASLFTIPEGAEITDIFVNVETAFTGTGNNDLDIGDLSTANRFADAVDMSTAGQIRTGFDEGELFQPLTADVTVTAIYNGTDPDAGVAQICIRFVLR